MRSPWKMIRQGCSLILQELSFQFMSQGAAIHLILIHQRLSIPKESFAHERMREAERKFRPGCMNDLCSGFSDQQLHIREGYFRQHVETVIRIFFRQPANMR